MFDSNMYMATTSAMTWCIVVELFFFLQLPSFASSPKTIACFMHASGYYKRVFLRIYEDACVSPTPHEVPDEGLSPVGTSIFFYCLEFFPLDAC